LEIFLERPILLGKRVLRRLTSAMAGVLTSNLRLELEKTNNAFARWADKQADWLGASETHFTQMMEECECTIKALHENDRQLDEVRVQNSEIKVQQRTEVEHYLTQTERLKQQKKQLEQHLRKAEEDEAKEMTRVDSARVELDEIRSKMERHLNDLTHGVRMYTSLGLEFLKAENDCMKFVFTQLDPKDPARQFYFLMFVDSEDRYQLVETNPTIPAQVAQQHIKTLNGDNNIGRFVVNMRKSFPL
jgi:myosin heavy subunit